MISTKKTSEFKKEAVKKFHSRGARPVELIAEEMGISKSILYKWAKEFGISADMTNKTKQPNKKSAEEKLNLIISFEKTDELSRGEFLRQNGIKAEYLEEWKRQIKESLNPSKLAPSRSDLAIAKKKVIELEKELARKNKALAETSALLVLKKKAHLIWGSLEEE